MLSKKIKIIALASALSTCVLTGTAVAGSYTPSLAEANAPTIFRRAHFAVKSGLVPDTIHVFDEKSNPVKNEYGEPFEIKITGDAENNAFTVKLNSSKTTFAAANIKSMCLVNIGRTNPYSFTFKVGNQSVGCSPENEKTLYPLYKDAAYFIDGKHYFAPEPLDHNDPHFDPSNSDNIGAVYFDLSGITGDITEFTIKADKMYIDINNYKGGIAFVYGCENR